MYRVACLQGECLPACLPVCDLVPVYTHRHAHTKPTQPHKDRPDEGSFYLQPRLALAQGSMGMELHHLPPPHPASLPPPSHPFIPGDLLTNTSLSHPLSLGFKPSLFVSLSSQEELPTQDGVCGALMALHSHSPYIIPHIVTNTKAKHTQYNNACSLYACVFNHL